MGSNKTEVVFTRCSRRKYNSLGLSNEIVQVLESQVKNYNQNSGLHMKLVINNGDAFGNFTKSFGMFSGVRNYIIIVGQKNDISKEKAGYYGEKLVLKATELGLGTCWVGATFDKNVCDIGISNNEELFCVIAIGYVDTTISFKEKFIRNAMHRNTKTIEQMYETDINIPKWFQDGMAYVQRAPSSNNSQTVKFLYKKGVVTAKIDDDSAFHFIDLGIAKLHFELGAGNGVWKFGNGAEFLIQK